tara:strand:- start:270 stop:809 length:540 start_codon:yes stop_codon:yes gene_type:complete
VLGRFALIFLLSFSCFSQEKLLVKDRALFRIDKQVFFKEAFVVWTKEWSRLQCVGNRSFLLRSLNLKPEDFKTVLDTLDVAERRSLTDSEKALVEKTISLVKFILYGQTQQVSSEAQLPESFSCLDKIKSPNIDLILRAEVIIRSKFKDNSQKDNKDDLFRAKSFIESIDKSKNHEIYL